MPYLSSKKTIDSWIEEIDRLELLKPQIKNKREYRFHPLNSISSDTIEFLKNQLIDTKKILDNLVKVFGNINEHLKALKDNFLIDEILENENLSNEFEIEIVKHLKEIIDGINKSNLITNVDAQYFSDNIKSMLMDYEREKAESGADELTLNVVNLENMQKFKITFFCMCEEDKYPRQYKVSFPFTENVIEILSNPKYGIEQSLSLLNL